MQGLKIYAKINLCLKIDGIYADGFHRLDMIMTSVNISDVVSFRPAGEIKVTTDGKASGADNTAYRACEALKRRGIIEGAEISIKKGIPVAAGLGGSSADAAAVIVAARRELGFDDKTAAACAAEVGSDVAFMLRGGAARARGKGEILDFFPLKTMYGVVAKPVGGVSTPRCYRKFDEIGSGQSCDTEATLAAILRGRRAELCNELFDAARLINPDVGKLYERLKELSDRVVMSGSGSAVCAFFDSERESIEAAEKIDAAFVRPIKTLEKGFEFI